MLIIMNGKKYNLPDWWARKSLVNYNGYAYSGKAWEVKVIKETKKAILIDFQDVDIVWCPKSIIKEWKFEASPTMRDAVKRMSWERFKDTFSRTFGEFPKELRKFYKENHK